MSSSENLITWMVVCHLIILAVCVVCFALFFLRLHRRRAAGLSPEQKLIEELAAEERAAAAKDTPEAPPAAPWERPPDWWKQA